MISVRMTKDIISINKDEWETEVNIKVPAFQNFGARMPQVEQEALDAILAEGGGEANEEEVDEEEAKKFDAELDGMMADMLQQSKAALEARMATLSPEERAQASAALAEMENFDWESDDEEEEDEEDGNEDQDCEEEEHDLQEFRVVCPAKSGWNDKVEAKLDAFLAGWPALRPRVLQSVCSYYQEFYRCNGFDKTPLDAANLVIMPAPGAPDLIGDRMRVTTIHLRKDGLIGLTGDCTWDEEHGFGLLLKDGEIIDAGQCDVAYDD